MNRFLYCLLALAAGASGALAAQGAVAFTPQPLCVAYLAHLSASTTSLSAAAMCWPQPFHVGCGREWRVLGGRAGERT